MKIESIAIKNLFGYYTYDIHLEEKGELFIITGLNGTGKTTIMRILDNLSQGKLHYFYELPFDSISIKFINNQDPTGQPIEVADRKKECRKQEKNE
jgi:Predicted ATP-binding protein involved in virulence